MSARHDFSRMTVRGAWLLCAMAILLIPRGVDAHGLTYSKGQTISPAYEGWEKNPNLRRSLDAT